jgi:predicted lipoprotein with Yx(FWY)xxD motif
MRKACVVRSVVVVLAVAASTVFTAQGVAAAATAKAAPPVALPGKVNNHGTESAAGNRISITAHSYYFSPTFVKAKSGTLTVMVENVSMLEHTFTVPGQNVDVDLRPGKQATVRVKVTSSGALLFYCKFHGPNGSDGDLGMQGAIYTAANQPIANMAAAAPTLKVATNATYGNIIVNGQNQTLYQRDSDTASQVTCTGACAMIWPPATLTGTIVAGVGIDPTKLGSVAGANGTQLTYAGHPLYRFTNDPALGDTKGEGLAGLWWVLGADGQKITAPAPTTTIPPPAGTKPTSSTTY